MTAKAAKAPTKKPKTTKKTAAKSKAAVAVKAEKAQKPETQAIKPVKNSYSVLRGWNLRLGVVLLVMAVAVVVFGGSQTTPITTQYLAKDSLASEAAGQEVLATATRHLWDVNISWIVAKFLVIFGVVYLLAATLLRKRYEAWLDRGVNALRWVGFGVGGGAIITAVAMLSGVSDISTMCLIFGSVVLAGLLTLGVELIGAGRRMRSLLGAGAIVAVFVPWLLFVRSIGAVPMYDASLPLYLYGVYASVTLLVVAVGLGVFFRVKQRGKWADKIFTEKMFMGLGFAAAVILALQIFAGALQA